MTTTAHLFKTGGSQAIRIPKDFRFPGSTVRLKKTKQGVLILPEDDLATRLEILKSLAGSCPDFPEREPHDTPDLPRDFERDFRA